MFPPRQLLSPTKIRSEAYMKKLRKCKESRRLDVLERDDFTCVYCENPGIEVDHILPWDWNGNDSEENLVACCRDCNSIAGDKIFPSFQEKKDYILIVRSSSRWQKKFKARTSICTSCKKTFNPRAKGASRFLCSKCYDDC